jgi:cytochrome c oxidase subunit 3
MKYKKYDDPKEDNFFGTSFLLYLVLAAISFLFLGVMGAYMYNRALFDLPGMQIPEIFYLSTLLIVGISFLVRSASHNYEQSDFNALFLRWQLILGALLLFIILQIYGWISLIDSGMSANANNSIGYLYVLSSLHIVHILIGFPFHIKELWRQYLAQREGDFSKMEYLSQESRKNQIFLIGRYWHFLDFLWVILMAFFIINSYFW